MKISLQWLSDFLPGALDAQLAADALTAGGLPVETIEHIDGDTVLDVEVTSNRSDCLSHIGVARELSALLNRDFRDAPAPPSESSAASTGVTGLSGLRIDAPDLCPHYTARVIRNVKIGPSPDWMRRRLHAVGVRSINNIVDVTNYVLFELGHPLHAFDLDKIQGGQIIVRRAAAGEKITSIDGHQRSLSPEMLVIADAHKPIALAGVMGGRESEVSDGSANIMVESARFDPLSVRSSARALAMGSDSSYRFERGIDPALAQRASLRATQLILETAGGRAVGPLLSAGSASDGPKKLWLRIARLHQVLGVEFPTQKVVESLHRLRLTPVLRGERIDVTIPSWRLDLNQEIDLVEEVARVIGYEKIPVRDEIRIRLAPTDLSQRATDTIRSTLVAGGFFEAVTFSFVTEALARSFAPPQAASLPRADSRVRKADAQLRPSILPGLLEAVRHNESAGTAGAKLFEIGSVFWNDPAGKTHEKRTLALACGTELRDLRGVIESLLSKLDADRSVRVIPTAAPGYAVGACGRIEWAGKNLGHIGLADAKIVEQLGLRESPTIAELDFSPLVEGAVHVPQLHPLPRFPAVRRDLSMVLAEDRPYRQLEELIWQIKPENLETFEYVTTYRGKPLDAGTKSVTVTLVFRSADGTLTSEAVESAVQKVIDAASSNLNAVLRT